jgi:hypothetical protein
LLNIKDTTEKTTTFFKNEDWPYKPFQSLDAYTYNLEENLKNSFLVDHRVQNKIDKINMDVEINLKELFDISDFSEMISALPYLFLEDEKMISSIINDFVESFKDKSSELFDYYKLAKVLPDYLIIYFEKINKIKDESKISIQNSFIDKLLGYENISSDEKKIIKIEHLLFYVEERLKDRLSYNNSDKISQLGMLKKETAHFFGKTSETLVHEKGDFYGNYYYDESLFYDIMGVARMGRVRMGFGPDST